MHRHRPDISPVLRRHYGGRQRTMVRPILAHIDPYMITENDRTNRLPTK